MRRLTYLGVVVVLLGILGSIFMRVGYSNAYIARARFLRIKEGMPVAEVRRIMADSTDARLGPYNIDIWGIGSEHEYALVVVYEGCEWDGRETADMWVKGKSLSVRAHQKGKLLDQILEYLGYPEAMKQIN